MGCRQSKLLYVDDSVKAARKKDRQQYQKQQQQQQQKNDWNDGEEEDIDPTTCPSRKSSGENSEERTE